MAHEFDPANKGPVIGMEDPMFIGMDWHEIEEELEKREKADLAREGVTLPDNHMDGYKYFVRIGKKKEAPLRGCLNPWEIKVKPPKMTTKKCTAAKWTHTAVKFEVGKGIAYITLDSADTNNALNDDVAEALFDAFTELRSRKDVRIVVLKSNGKMFCAGGDAKSFQKATDMTESDNKESITNLASLLNFIQTLPQFTLALVQGSCMGTGVGLAAACDMCVAVRAAHFQLQDAKLGFVPAAVLPFVMGKVGVSHAKRIICTCENCSADKAFEMGMVQEVVGDASGLTEWVTKLSEAISLCGPAALTSSKNLAAHVSGQPVSLELLDFTANELARVRKGPEADVGMKAVIARKKPFWAEDPIVP